MNKIIGFAFQIFLLASVVHAGESQNRAYFPSVFTMTHKIIQMVTAFVATASALSKPAPQDGPVLRNVRFGTIRHSK